MSRPPPPWNQLLPPSPLKVSAALEPIAPSMLVSVSVSLPRLAVPATQIDHDRGAAAEAGEIDAVAAVEQVVAGPAVEHVAAVLAVQRVVAAQAWIRSLPPRPERLLAASVPVSTSLLGGGVGGERLVALGRADVGQAAGRQRAGDGRAGRWRRPPAGRRR